MSEKNLFKGDAKAKFKELVEDIDFTMMETNLGARPSHIIPMSTKEVDEQGAIWFLSNRNSEHNAHIGKDPDLQLIYSKPGNMEFLTLYGKASIIDDRAVIERFYGKMDDTWFKGVDDPNVTAIKVVPSEAHYWDTKHSKLVTLFKMGMGILTGNTQDIGEEGELNL